MIKHSATSCNFHWRRVKIYAVLVAISVVIIANTINAFKLNITSIHQNDPQIGYIYANHRMNNSVNATSTADSSSETREYNSKGNSLNESLSNEHSSLETVLRPQLALQIYTSPVGSKTRELQTEFDKKLTAKASLLPSALENSRKYLLSPATRNTDLWQYDTSDQVRVDPSEQPSGSDNTNLESPFNYNMVNPRLQTTAGSVSPMINAIITLPSGVDKIYRQSSAQSSASGQRPSISDGERSDSREAKSSTHQNGSVNVERAIRQLIDSQTIGGNIEFSMNMNGDEIVINPVGRHAASVLRTSLATEHQPFVESDGDGEKLWRKQNELPVRPSPEHRTLRSTPSNDENLIISRSLKRHFSSPEFPDDQHSASEIDLVDGNHSSSLHDDDNDDSSSDNSDDARQQATKARSYKKRASRRDLDGHARRAHTDSYINEQSPDNNTSWFLARSKDEHDSDSNADNDLLNDPLGEPRVNPREKSSQREQRRASIETYRNQDETSRGKRTSRPLKFKQSKRANHKRHSTEIQSDDNESDQSTGGSTQALQRNDGTSSQRRSEKQPAAIIIKGENVKKFEQLLENLKSLSMNSLAPLGSKVRSYKVGQNQRTDSLDEKYDSDNDSSDDEQQTDSESKQKFKSGSWQPAGFRGNYNSSSSMGSGQHLARGTSASRTFDVAAECDKYRRGHKSQKSASNTVESTSLINENEPSATNVADGEPIANGDASDELNDEGSQNIEHEEDFDMDGDDSSSSSSDNQQLDALESDVTSQKLPGTQVKEKPKSLFVRKTILQTYFDTSGSNSTEGNEDSMNRQTGGALSGEARRKSRNDYHATKLRENNDHGSLSRAHEAKGHVGRPARDIFDDQLIDAASEDSRDGGTSNKDHSSGGYIDYNRLDDREVVRGSESQRFRVALPLNEKTGPARHESTSRRQTVQN